MLKKVKKVKKGTGYFFFWVGPYLRECYRARSKNISFLGDKT